MNEIGKRLDIVRKRITLAEQQYARAPGSVKLLAVSKTHTIKAIHAAMACGQTSFGENYLQEALTKINTFAEHALEWHFIGAVQSNKTRQIATHFTWVHSIERLKTAERLDQQRPAKLPPLNVCLQVNISGEVSKAGLDINDLLPVAQAVADLPRIKLRGLMAIPAPSDNLPAQRRPYKHLREALEQLNAGGLRLDTLSMGMSNDLEAAIAEGATIVRVGSAIFGPRRR